jgi:DHA2 family multidrug resistance protein-like MFS transporter
MDSTTPLNTSAPPASAPRATWREWVGLAVLALPTLLLALDNSVLFLALPHLGADLRPSSTQLLWISDLYGFMIAGFLITMGTLGDRIGRRRLLLIGAVAFGLASVLAAYSTSAGMLIAARALLGVAGATLMPSTLALISNMFRDPKQRGMAIAVWMSCFLAGVAIGPVTGGLLLESFWWGSVFLMGVPVMVLLLVAGPVLLPEYRDPNAAGRLDLTSVALSLAAILPVIYGLKEFAADGFGTLPVVAVVAGAVFGAAFVRRQRRLPDPLLDLRLFSHRAVSAALAVMLLATAIIGGVFLFVTQHLQLVEELSPLRAGLWMVPSALGVIAGNMLAPPVAQRIGPGRAVAGGLVVSAVGLALLTQVGATGSLGLLVVGYSVAFFGIGPLGVLATDLVVGSAPPEKAGAASAMSETTGEFGIALGIATLGSVGTAVYRDQITGSLPADVPAEAAAAAGDTLAGAVAAAESLPAGLAAGLLEPARDAFTSGLNVVTGIGVAAVLAFAVVALVLLRNVRV